MPESVPETIFIALEGESLKKKKKPKKATKKDNSPSKKSMEAEPKVTNNFDINESFGNEQEEGEEILIKQEPKENELEKTIEEESNVDIEQDDDEVNPNNQQEGRTEDKEVKEHNNKEVEDKDKNQSNKEQAKKEQEDEPTTNEMPFVFVQVTPEEKKMEKN